MGTLEAISELNPPYFVDLFVRVSPQCLSFPSPSWRRSDVFSGRQVSNAVAVEMYTKLGYIVYRTVLDYYSGSPDEDAFDMRKALSRDVHKKSVVPLKVRALSLSSDRYLTRSSLQRPVTASEVDF